MYALASDTAQVYLSIISRRRLCLYASISATEEEAKKLQAKGRPLEWAIDLFMYLLCLPNEESKLSKKFL